MRSLTLLRHAKSSWGDDSLDDFDRPLNDRGQDSAAAMGQHLASSGARFDLVHASPARRVVETLAGLAAGGWSPGEVKFDRAVYHATASDLISLLRSTADDVRRLLIIGHNPAIGTLATQLTDDDEQDLRAAVSAGYPAGALAEIELFVDRWDEVRPQCGRLVAFTPPRSLPGA